MTKITFLQSTNKFIEVGLKLLLRYFTLWVLGFTLYIILDLKKYNIHYYF